MKKPFIVGFAGGSGSGKTTLSRIVAAELAWETQIVPLDQFYRDLSHLPMEERAAINFDDPDSIDISAAEQAISTLRQGQPVGVPVYDFATFSQTEQSASYSPAPIILVEGMHALYHLSLLELFDLTVFLDIDEPTRWQRKLERDIQERGRTYEQVLQMWETHTKPTHYIYVWPTRIRANLLFNESFAPEVISAITETIQRKVGLLYNDSAELPQ
ncbi:uridine kinase [Patescibacteria group bacterium]